MPPNKTFYPKGFFGKLGKRPAARTVQVFNKQTSDIEAGAVLIADVANLDDDTALYVKTSTTPGDGLVIGVAATKLLANAASPGYMGVWGVFPVALTDVAGDIAQYEPVGCSETDGLGGRVFGGNGMLGFALDAETGDAVLGTASGYTDVFVCPGAAPQIQGSTTVAADVLVIPITHRVVVKTTGNDAEALTLADGAPGQLLTVVLGTAGGGVGTLTPATKTGWATALFEVAGDTMTFEFVDETVGWIVHGVAGTAAATLPTITV